MRKTGLYILLGVTISVAIFVLAGILYFQPVVIKGKEAVKAIPSYTVEVKKVEKQKVEPTKEVPKVEQQEPIEKEAPPQVIEKVIVEKAPVKIEKEIVPATIDVVKTPAPLTITLTVTPYEEPIEQVIVEEVATIEIKEPVVEVKEETKEAVTEAKEAVTEVKEEVAEAVKEEGTEIAEEVSQNISKNGYETINYYFNHFSSCYCIKWTSGYNVLFPQIQNIRIRDSRSCKGYFICFNFQQLCCRP